jgi:hypothetical protein
MAEKSRQYIAGSPPAPILAGRVPGSNVLGKDPPPPQIDENVAKPYQK